MKKMIIFFITLILLLIGCEKVSSNKALIDSFKLGYNMAIIDILTKEDRDFEKYMENWKKYKSESTKIFIKDCLK